jgi:hypothetical protein
MKKARSQAMGQKKVQHDDSVCYLVVMDAPVVGAVHRKVLLCMLYCRSKLRLASRTTRTAVGTQFADMRLSLHEYPRASPPHATQVQRHPNSEACHAAAKSLPSPGATHASLARFQEVDPDDLGIRDELASVGPKVHPLDIGEARSTFNASIQFVAMPSEPTQQVKLASVSERHSARYGSLPHTVSLPAPTSRSHATQLPPPLHITSS